MINQQYILENQSDNEDDKSDQQDQSNQSDQQDQSNQSDQQDQSNQSDQQDQKPSPSSGSEVKDMIVNSTKDTAKQYVNDLIENNRDPNPSPVHRKVLGDFFKHVVKNYDSYPVSHKQKINDSVSKMADEAISGADAVSTLVNNYQDHKGDIKGIMSDINTMRHGDTTQKIDTILKNYMKYKKYISK